MYLFVCVHTTPLCLFLPCVKTGHWKSSSMRKFCPSLSAVKHVWVNASFSFFLCSLVVPSSVVFLFSLSLPLPSLFLASVSLCFRHCFSFIRLISHTFHSFIRTQQQQQQVKYSAASREAKNRKSCQKKTFITALFPF